MRTFYSVAHKGHVGNMCDQETSSNHNVYKYKLEYDTSWNLVTGYRLQFLHFQLPVTDISFAI